MSIENNNAAEAARPSFADLNLAEPLLKAVLEEGYTIPTPIQAQAIPLVLQGGDLLASAQTGTGKTAGFTLPILHRLLTNPDHHQRAGRPRCLILTPTRELAGQVEESVKTYGKHAAIKSMVMFGGVGINPQIQALKRRVDIVVATPGRLLDHAGQKTIDLSGIEILVLDEADRMLDMGFIHDIRKVLALLPAKRQNLLFSATFSDDVKALADRLLNKPGYIEVARRNAASQQVSQAVHLVPQSHKRDALVHLIKTHRWPQVLVFTRTKHGANRLAEHLDKNGISAAAIHGNKSQSARTQALSKFKEGSLPVLVATDIAARGLDIDQLPQVVNFELPNVAEDYVHRIGRTGRAGATGAALSLVDGEEIKLLAGIEKLIKRGIERLPLEGFVPPPKSASAAATETRQPRTSQPRAHQARTGRGNAEAASAGRVGARSEQGRGQAGRAHPEGQERRRDGKPGQPSGRAPSARGDAARTSAPAGNRGRAHSAAARTDKPAAAPQHARAGVQEPTRTERIKRQVSALFSRKGA